MPVLVRTRPAPRHVKRGDGECESGRRDEGQEISFAAVPDPP